MCVYVSTGAFETKDINRILDIAAKYDIRNIELSPGLDYCDNILQIISDASDDFNFLIHNYFPTPISSFALNMASADERIKNKSIEMCCNNIKFAADNQISFYSLHCGFCFDTDGRSLGNSSQIELPMISYEMAEKTFVRNIQYICDYAMARNISIAIENNVVAEFATNHRKVYLGVDGNDMVDLQKKINRKNLGLLLDLAHAKVSAKNLNFDMDSMVSIVSNSVIEVHISENNGYVDQNLPLTRDSSLLKYLKMFTDIPITIEVYDLCPELINEQISIVNEFRGGC